MIFLKIWLISSVVIITYISIDGIAIVNELKREGFNYKSPKISISEKIVSIVPCFVPIANLFMFFWIMFNHDTIKNIIINKYTKE